HALEVAQAREFVAEMPGGLEAPIEQGGANLSGGQRQRLSIARALVKKPLIYLFDDSFSALDFATDARLRAALKKETREATVLVVAQRVSSIMQADQILVLDQGTICGKGTHKELLATCACYQEIVYSQLSAEEVA
ncbi:MAG: ABC transporter ATP-binding protein, partial [Thermoleophilia bacterium]|nr:ABC transporter ATP-binding protein [Thermoleophilia bacterium]